LSITASVLIGLVGSVVTLGLFLLSVTFRMGEHSSRLQELEKWRDNIRVDMHEISDLLFGLDKKLTEVKTLVEERTNRRQQDRP
jgi:hypothetical protein